MRLFHEFVGEATGEGIDTGKHAASLTLDRVSVLHDSISYILQDRDGQIVKPYSVSAGLDYPDVGPEHSYFKEIKRGEYYRITVRQALTAFKLLSQLEGII